MKTNAPSRTAKFKMIVILVIAAALSLGIYVLQGNEVSIDVDGKVTNLVSYSDTVQELIETEEVNFSEKAFINVPLDSKLENNIEIIIRNPIPYTIDYKGNLFETTSFHDTVEEVLADHQIKLGEKDYTYPEVSQKISPNTTISIYRVTEEVEVVESTIPFEEQVVTNRNLDLGVMNTIQKGKDGLKRQYIKKEYINGELVSEELEREEVVEEPVDLVKEKGARDFILTSRGDTRFRKSITMTATAYDLSFESTGKRPGDRNYGITASGTKARPGVVAVDPRVIPLGTKLYIKSLDGSKDYGFAIAEDKGGAIKGNKIDLFFETAEQVRQFGRRKVKVYVLD
ncbi:MAG: 3D domain-containing protein [Tissierellaceae bacterium]|nr:3D domain-containing protein [Tissierellaceae bacterium]